MDVSDEITSLNGQIDELIMDNEDLAERLKDAKEVIEIVARDRDCIGWDKKLGCPDEPCDEVCRAYTVYYEKWGDE